MTYHPDVEEIEITALPYGFLECIHVPPEAGHKYRHVTINECSRCKSVGGHNFPDNKLTQECDFCGIPVTMGVGKANWVEISETVIVGKNRFGRNRTEQKRVSGKWTKIT